jgi:plastocyanin
MGRSATKLAALLCCGLCALWALSAIAFAAPKSAATHRHRASSARCQAKKAHLKKRVRGRSAACRTTAAHHSKLQSAHKAPAPSEPTSSGSSTGTSSTGASTGAGSSAPSSGASQPTSTTESTEAAPPTAPPTVPHVQITAVEYSFTLSRTTVPAGKVIFQFVNHGQDEHNLNVAPNSEGAVAGTFSNLQSQGVSNQEIELKPGSYTLFCSLPEHEKKGMKATLVVE